MAGEMLRVAWHTVGKVDLVNCRLKEALLGIDSGDPMQPVSISIFHTSLSPSLPFRITPSILSPNRRLPGPTAGLGKTVLRLTRHEGDENIGAAEIEVRGGGREGVAGGDLLSEALR